MKERAKIDVPQTGRTWTRDELYEERLERFLVDSVAATEVLRTYISRRRIQTAVRQMARDIEQDYAEVVGAQPGQELVLVGSLKGAFVFLADLVRELTLPVVVDFVRLASYKGGTTTSGTVRLLVEPSLDLRGRHVLAVEDIVDTGLTAQRLLEELERHEPASLSLCALLDKPGRRQAEAPIRYTGFTIGDVFAVGYGLDYAERYRNLPDIRVFAQE